MVAKEIRDPVKERILTHARTRFFEEGITRVSVADITADLGMSKKTFYKSFARKEDLVHEIVSRMLGDIELSIEGILSLQAPFPDKVDALVRVVGGVFKTLSKQMLRDLQAHVPEAWARIRKFRQVEILRTWSGLIDEGTRTGYVRPEINQRVFLLSLYAAVENVVNPTVLADESFSCDDALESIIAIFLTGILTDQAAGTFHRLHHTS